MLTITATNNLIRIAGFIAPIISELICIALIIAFCIRNQDKIKNKLCKLMFAGMSCNIFCWICLIAYTIYPQFYIEIQAFFYIAILYNMIVTYHFVFMMTKTGEIETFRPIHYLIPLLIGLTLLIWSFFVPEEVKLYIIKSRGKYPEGYDTFAFLTNSKSHLFLIYNILYSICGLKRISRFRNVLGDYSADEGHSSVNWLILLIYTTIATLPISIVPSLLGMNIFLTFVLTFIPAFLVILKDVMLTYNFLAENYIIIDISPSKDNLATDVSFSLASNRPNKESFERYIHKHKPFLNPQLRITDLAQDLNTNRTYLSGFINQEYQMNFSRFINRCRLKELEKLRRNPENFHKSGMELVQEAGFSNYRAYQRVKKEEDKRSTLIL